jgi:hypothetical protein
VESDRDRWWGEGWRRGFVVGVFFSMVIGLCAAVTLVMIYWMRGGA